MDCSPPGSPIHGILQARKLEWVAISFSIFTPVLCFIATLFAYAIVYNTTHHLTFTLDYTGIIIEVSAERSLSLESLT